MSKPATPNLLLTPMQAFACQGVYRDKRPAAEVARAAGVRTPDAIRMRTLRARKRLAAHPSPAIRRYAAALAAGGKRVTVVPFSLNAAGA